MNYQKAREYREKARQLRSNYLLTHPWAKFHEYINKRCYRNKDSTYFKMGIQNYLNTSDIKFLWFRDHAELMKEPSIHRLDNSKHYTLDNCVFIERKEHRRITAENQRKPILQFSPDGMFLKRWPSVYEAGAMVGGRPKRLSECLIENRPYQGFKWAYAERGERQ